MIEPAHHEPLPQQYNLVAKSAQKNEISEIAHRILAHSFAIQFADHGAFHHFGEGDIVVLLGTSTAGKSSIISALRQLEPARLEHGIDLAGNLEVLDYIQNHFPEDYAFLQSVLIPMKDERHIHDAIGAKLFHFRPDVSEADQLKAKAAAAKIMDQMDKNLKLSPDRIEGRMMEEVIAFSLCGKDSIFDILEIDNVFRNILKHNFHAPVRTALVYCPFHLLTERLASRNRKALENNDFFEVRAGVFPLFQFAKLFGPKQKADDLVIETITREIVEKAFDTNFDCEVDFMRKTEPGQLATRDLDKERAEGKKALLEAFGFTPGVHQIELTPKFKRYDFLIDTSKASPGDIAKALKKTGRQ